MKKKYQISLIVIVLMLVCTIFVATSYALWSITVVQTDSNIVTTGCFNASLKNDNPINLSGAYPIQESKGLEQTPYTFTITNTCTIAASYEINLESLSTTTLDEQYLRVSLDKQMSTLYNGMKNATKFYNTSKSAKFLTKGKLAAGESATYDLRLWLDYDATLETTANKTFEAKIIVLNTATSYETLAEKVEIGDYISVSPTAESYEIPTTLTGYDTVQTINPRELNLWRVIRKNDNGTVDVVSEYVSSTDVYFKGQTGYMNLVGGLNTIASAYTNNKYVSETRHMGYSGQIFTCTSLENCPTDTGYETDTNLVQAAIGTLVGKKTSGTAEDYWLSSRYVTGSAGTYYGGRWMDETARISYTRLLAVTPGTRELEVEAKQDCAVRPILTLKSSLEPTNGDGESAETPYTFE